LLKTTAVAYFKISQHLSENRKTRKVAGAKIA